MGIFDFVKKAGAKIFGKDKPESHGEPYKPLRKHVEEHGINADKLAFHFENGVLVVDGWVPTQETREKVILIVGNVEGVGQVDDRINVGNPPSDWKVTTGKPLPTLEGGSSQTVARQSAGSTGGDWTSRTYTVVKGDTLSKIAKEMYGDASKYPVIFEANKPMLKDPDKIYPGQVLRIPPK